MNPGYRNLMWVGFLAILFFLYYSQLGGYWLGKESVDPLIVNFVVAPALFGFVAYLGLRGELFGKLLFFVAMPIVPCLVLGQEGDPAKPGLQWLLIAAMQLPYWVGGATGCISMFWCRKCRPPNKSTQPTQ
ncbi:hypothetical protein [Thiohalophilus thiocyanatoxydans]|uniref:hypothetical protein n=1 Tax=Thiohalophilus thiocyanatoxydans TaxID=381308 RepID=UPI0010649BB2|nr:hypothetical protein [Thiohalophilus thiocyanatoxydans]